MSDYANVLRKFKPTQEFFIGIDSDGCVFDSMEIKHKECFAPMFIKHFSMQAVSKYAREVWEFVNLYSKTRGCNRFHALIRALDLLRERNEVVSRGVDVPSFPALLEWVNRESKLGNATLDAEVLEGGRVHHGARGGEERAPLLFAHVAPELHARLQPGLPHLWGKCPPS